MTVSDLMLVVVATSIPAAIPLLYASLGELIYEKSGVLNLGLEGTMLLGAMAAVQAQTTWGSPFVSILAAAGAAAIAGLVHAVLCVHFRTNQVVTGLAFVVLLSGLTAFWGQDLVGRRVEIDLVFSRSAASLVPGVGPLLLGQDVLTYLSLLLALLSWWVLFRTRWGTRLRASGEDAEAAVASGIPVAAVRLLAGAVAGAMAGLGGAYLSLAYASQWQENMVAGRGWIAVVLVIFARWRIGWLVVSAFLFGALSVLQLNLQAFGIDSSSYLIGMVPFILAILALALASWLIRNRPSAMPAGLGRPLETTASR